MDQKAILDEAFERMNTVYHTAIQEAGVEDTNEQRYAALSAMLDIVNETPHPDRMSQTLMLIRLRLKMSHYAMRANLNLPLPGAEL